MAMVESHRRGHRRLRPELRRQRAAAGGPAGGHPEPAGQRHGRDRGRDGHEHGAAQPRARSSPPPATCSSTRTRAWSSSMRFVPGPTCPPAATSSAWMAIREAYETGRGIFRTRATTKIEQLNARKTGIVVTELPYGIGPEKVVTRIKDLVQAKKITGISDLKDLTDRQPRPEPGHRGPGRLQPRGRPRRAVPAHADGGDVRHQQRRPRRRPAAHCSGLTSCWRSTSATGSRSSGGAPSSAAASAGPAAPGRRPAHRAAQHRRGHPGHPHERRRRRRQAAACARSSTCPRSRPSTSWTPRCAG